MYTYSTLHDAPGTLCIVIYIWGIYILYDICACQRLCGSLTGNRNGDGVWEETGMCSHQLDRMMKVAVMFV